MKPLHRLGVAISILILLAVVFWAGYIVGSPSQAPQEQDAQTTVHVQKGSIEHKLTLTTSVSRQPTPVTINPLSGYVLSVSADTTASQGTQLYRVGENPVIAVVGSTPFWRDLAPGHKGPDVAQLNQMLVDTGYLRAPSDAFSEATNAAMKAFLAKQGAPYSGAVVLGQLIAIPATQTPIMLDRSILYPGARLNGGEKLVSILAGDPSFSMIVTPTQASMIPPGTSVKIHHGDLVWEGIVGASSPTDDGIRLELSGLDGASICGQQCDQLPADATTSLLTDVVLIPPASGLTVPVAALNTHADGRTTVTRVKAGLHEPVPATVVGVSGGIAVIEGVDEGDAVLIGKSESES